MGTQSDTALEGIAVRVKDLLGSLRQPVLAPFLADWPPAYSRREIAAAGLPVLRWLSELAGGAAPICADLVAAVCRAAPMLDWRQTYTTRDVPPAFLDDYGWSEIVGSVGPIESDRIACGFLILGPATYYPSHRHAAEELYVPLCGTAAWQQGDTAWQEWAPGTPIHHRSGQPHAMRTGTTPLLALYVWRGANLGQKARLDVSATPLVQQ